MHTRRSLEAASLCSNLLPSREQELERRTSRRIFINIKSVFTAFYKVYKVCLTYSIQFYNWFLNKATFCVGGNMSIKIKFMKILTQRGMIIPKRGVQMPQSFDPGFRVREPKLNRVTCSNNNDNNNTTDEKINHYNKTTYRSINKIINKRVKCSNEWMN